MVTITSSPQANNSHRMIVESDNIEELLIESLSKIRESSKVFYKKELRSDLTKNGTSIIDSHAGMRFTYIVNLLKK